MVERVLTLSPLPLTVGASSQCYWDELMLLKCELMLFKCQINTDTYKNGCLLSTKCLERALKYSHTYFQLLNFFYNHFVLICHFTIISSYLITLAHTLIALSHTLIALSQTLKLLSHTLIALTDLTEKMLPYSLYIYHVLTLNSNPAIAIPEAAP